MFSGLLAIFSSGGFGSLVGLVGGYFNRKLDLQAKGLEYADKDKQRAHELAKQNADLEFMKAEYTQRLQVANVEADAEVEVAGYGAMGKSYQFAAPTSADGWVDKASKVVRPLLTIGFLLFTIYVFMKVQTLVNELQVQPDQTQVFKLYVTLIEWATFQAGVCIGWWFAMRPGRQPK